MSSLNPRRGGVRGQVLIILTAGSQRRLCFDPQKQVSHQECCAKVGGVKQSYPRSFHTFHVPFLLHQGSPSPQARSGPRCWVIQPARLSISVQKALWAVALHVNSGVQDLIRAWGARQKQCWTLESNPAMWGWAKTACTPVSVHGVRWRQRGALILAHGAWWGQCRDLGPDPGAWGRCRARCQYMVSDMACGLAPWLSSGPWGQIIKHCCFIIVLRLHLN